jgi:hypothetical protein
VDWWEWEKEELELEQAMNQRNEERVFRENEQEKTKK